MQFRQSLIAVCFVLFSGAGAPAQQFTISTFAGTGTQGYADSAAKSAQFAFPGRLLFDSSGKLYIADGGNNRIRVISGGNVTTFAGNGTAGYSGDGSAATSAELNNPTGIALDSSGNLYIADSGNLVIRKISGSTISTVAGENSLGVGYSGDGAAATSAQMNDPTDVAVDSTGNIFIADAGNSVIREVTVADGNIATVVGGPATTLQLSHPDAVVFDSKGVLYIADTGNRRIVKFANGVASVVAGTGDLGWTGDGGSALDASFADPMGFGLDAAGNIYIADTFNGRVRKVSTDGIVTTIAGTGIQAYFGDGGTATEAGIFFPHDVATDSSGNVYVADTYNHVIRELVPTAPKLSANGAVNGATFLPAISPGALATVFGTGFSSQDVQGTLPLPLSLADVIVTVNGKAAPILYITPLQINFQVPWETQVGTAQITVTVSGRVSNQITVPVSIAAPGLFTTGGRAIAQNADLSLNSPSNPAKAGSIITVYATGSGPVNPAVKDGAASPNPAPLVTSSVSAKIGSEDATVKFAGLTSTYVGLLQLNIEIPSGLASGTYPLVITIAGESSKAANVSVTQ